MDDTHTIDLAEMAPVTGSKHHKYKYILVCVDVFTRFLNAIPLTNKNNESIKDTLLEIWKISKPAKIWSDRESALLSKELTKLLKDNNVELYHTENEGKAVIAERAIRYMRESLAKLQSKDELSGTKSNWYYNLPVFIEFYNQHHHRSITMSPNDARDTANHKYLRDILFKRFYDRPVKKAKYAINDEVRIHKYSSLFTKKSKNTNYTEEIFTIAEIINTRPIVYKIKDNDGELIKGTFSEWELVKVSGSL